jgi:hypothetical protein
MRQGFALDLAATVILVALASSPAFAGCLPPTPAPVAGVGIGAVALLGFGYRALKRRSGK